MKRNKFGINIDQGIPLSTDLEFDKLYVPCHKSSFQGLESWLKEANTPLVFGGQIGCGKSTLIEKAFKETGTKPDIVLHFDQEGGNLALGDFWRIVLNKFCEYALIQDVDLSEFSLPKEFAHLSKDNWQEFLKKLSLNEFSLEAFKEKEKMSRKFTTKSEYIKKIVTEIGHRIIEKIDRPLLIFASGIDKYNIESPAYDSLQNVIASLVLYKTLFEVNAVHLFLPSSSLSNIEKIFIFSMSDETINTVLQKRMGIYDAAISKEITVLSQWAGGNPRQALRLLTHYQAVSKNKENTDRIISAIHAATRDFFAYERKPDSAIMQYIKRHKKIAASEFILPGDKDTARLALYGNWFFIRDNALSDEWPAEINPLVKNSFEKVTPEEPEMQALKSYAEEQGISQIGLSFQRKIDNKIKKSGINLLNDIFQKDIDNPVVMNLAEILEMMSAALLSKDRSDRVIIAYKDTSVLKAAQAYLFAKANTYEYQCYYHTILKGGAKQAPLPRFFEILTVKTDIFSIEFNGNWTSQQLQALDKLRDRLMPYQMIWWIEHNKLPIFIQEWVQLRQLFEIFVLEDELLRSLSIDEIESDLNMFKVLIENKDSAEANVVTNLKSVLRYLRKVRGGEKE